MAKSSRTVTLEHVDAWYHALKVVKSVAEAHRAMKIWRALWQVAAAMHYCPADQDSSFGIRRETPKGRSAAWEEGEVVKLVKEAWRRKRYGLACIIAINYDSQFAPIDARSLRLKDSRTRSHRRRIYGRPICRSTRLQPSWRTRRGKEAAGGSGTTRQGQKLKLSAAELKLAPEREAKSLKRWRG